jgi:DNA-binding LytR/AlgR family response regulator
MLRCIIVEDEPIAAEILTEYIAATPALQLTHTCPDAVQAMDVLNNNPVDVIFLDINLPTLSGLEFVKSLPRPPKIILTTAYHQYALQGFELQVVDYLLKPIEFSRFSQAVAKLATLTARSREEPAPADQRPFYFFNVSKRAVKIYLDEIRYIESLKDAVSIHTDATTYHTHYQLGELEEFLQANDFLRIHRSFLVPVRQIRSFTATSVEIDGRRLPIGRSHKTAVMERLKP